MIKTLIIEDEEPAANRLVKLLTEIEPEIDVIDVIDSVTGAVKWLSNNPDPDLMMLDIQLADGLSFDIFKEIKTDSFVIFTTAYDEYAIKAFELNSIDYLLKPIDKEKLRVSINKFRKLNPAQPQYDLKSLIDVLESKSTQFKKRFVINMGTKIKSLEVTEIAIFYSLEKNTFLANFSGQHYPVDFSLDRLESMLNPELFFRINRKHIVQYNAIKNIRILSKSRIELSVEGYEEPVLVSTAKAHTFRNWLDN